MTEYTNSYRETEIIDLYLGEYLSQRFQATILSHSITEVNLYVQIGMPIWKAKTPNSQHLRDIPHSDRPRLGFDFVEDTWTKGNAIITRPFNKHYAIWTMLDKNLAPCGWYINLERRYRNAEASIIRDFELDIIVDREFNLSAKDVESYLEKTGTPGYWSEKDVEYIPKAYREIVSAIAQRSQPFNETLHTTYQNISNIPVASILPPYPNVRRITDWEIACIKEVYENIDE